MAKRESSVSSNSVHLSPVNADPLASSHSYSPDKNRATMLHRVYTTWIEGVLEKSLQHVPFLHLDLEEYPSALDNPWAKEVQETRLPSRVLPKGTTILQVYEQAEGKLLLLGEPGAGKTTLLLELVRLLLIQAEADVRFCIPVVFNLSSWPIKRSSIEEWLIEELRIKYRIPRKIGQAWVENNQLALFLDGLDEVAADARLACIDAIQAYHIEHARVPLMVSCRRKEYFSLATRVSLQNAALVKPLTKEQIDHYLRANNHQFEIVRQALKDDPELEEMVQTPLMLNIAAFAYQGENAPLALSGSKDDRRKQILKMYVQKTLDRRATPSYTPQETVERLVFLAKQMNMHNQSMFYLERVQPDWAEGHLFDQYRLMVNRIIVAITVLIFSALLACFRGDFVPHDRGLFYWLGGGQGDSVLGWMAPGMGGALPGAISIALLFALVAILMNLLGDRKRVPNFTKKDFQRSLLAGLRWGGLSTLIIGIVALVVFNAEKRFTCLGGSISGLGCGGSLGVFGGVIVGFQIAFITLFRYDPRFFPKEKKPRQSRFSVKDRFWNFWLFTLCGYVGFASVYSWQDGKFSLVVLSYSLIPAVYFGIMYHQGFETGLGPELGIAIQLAETGVWSWQEVRLHIWENLKKGASLAGILLVCSVIIITCMSSFFYGPGYGVRYGLVYGAMVAFVGGVTGMFMGVLASGWSNDMLDERAFARPNEGTRRSIRNAMFAACLFGPLGGLASGLMSAFAFALGGVGGWLILGTGLAIIFTLGGAYEIFMLYGGTALVEHYALRWFLWRKGALPWDCVVFLDYAVERILMRKVGGGYMFIHRLLLEYFAEIETREQEDHP